MPGRHPRLTTGWRHPVELAALACALVLSACGDDSGGSTDAAATTSEEDAGLTVVVEPRTANPGAMLTASVRNETAEQFTYGAGYGLQRQAETGFEDVEIPANPVPAIGYVAQPGKVGPPVEVMLPADLEPGTYRVVLMGDVPGGELYGEFEVGDGG